MTTEVKVPVTEVKAPVKPDGGEHHPHAEMPQKGHAPWQTVVTLVAALVTASVLLVIIKGWIDDWGTKARTEERIGELEKRITELTEKKADSSGVKNLEELVGKKADDNAFKNLEKVGKKADNSDLKNLEDLVAEKANATVVENVVNTQNGEITNLRNQVSNTMNSYSNATGKYDTAATRDAADIAVLKNDVCLLNKEVSKMEGTLEERKSDPQSREKLAGDIVAVRERLAALEAALSLKKP